MEDIEQDTIKYYLETKELVILANCILFSKFEISKLKVVSDSLDSNLKFIKNLIEKYPFIEVKYYYDKGAGFRILLDTIESNPILIDEYNRKDLPANEEKFCKVIINRINELYDTKTLKEKYKELQPDYQFINDLRVILNGSIGIEFFIKQDFKNEAEKFLDNYLELFKNGKLKQPEINISNLNIDLKKISYGNASILHTDWTEEYSFEKNLELFTHFIKKKEAEGINLQDEYNYSLANYVKPKSYIDEDVNYFLVKNKLLETLLWLNKHKNINLKKISLYPYKNNTYKNTETYIGWNSIICINTILDSSKQNKKTKSQKDNFPVEFTASEKELLEYIKSKIANSQFSITLNEIKKVLKSKAKGKTEDKTIQTIVSRFNKHCRIILGYKILERYKTTNEHYPIIQHPVEIAK